MKKNIAILFVIFAASSMIFAQDFNERQLELKEKVIEALKTYGDYHISQMRDGGLEITSLNDTQWISFRPMGEYGIVVSQFTGVEKNFRFDSKIYSVIARSLNKKKVGVKVFETENQVFVAVESITFDATNYDKAFIPIWNLIRSTANNVEELAIKLRENH